MSPQKQNHNSPRDSETESFMIDQGHRRPVWLWLFGCFVLTLSNCAFTEDSYLVQATDHATQTEILQYFGQPTLTHVLGTGRSVRV